MSLISDAIKTAQKERADRAQAEKSQQQVVDGFFPYVATSPAKRSRRVPTLVVGGLAVVLMAIVAWKMWQEDPKPSRPPIILPPPVTVSQRPPVVDSTKVAATEPQPAVIAAPDTARRSGVVPPPSANRDASPLRPRGQSAVTTAEAAHRSDSTPAQTIRVISPVRIDYEAQAIALFNADDLPGAKGKFELAVRSAPNARAWTNYGVTLQRLGDTDGAAAAYRAAVGMDANYLEAWLYQGRLAADRRDVAKAVPLFERARAINPKNAEVNVELARLEYDAKNYGEARRFAEDALRSDGTNSRAYWYLGVASDPLKDAEGSYRGYSGYLKFVGDARNQDEFVGWARTRLAQLQSKP